MKHANSEKGFTLIEILIVISIISILFLILIPQVNSYFTKSNESGIRTDFREFQQSTEAYLRETLGIDIQIDSLNKFMDTSHSISNNGSIKQTKSEDPWGNPYEVEFGTKKIMFASYGEKEDSTYKKYSLVVYFHKGVVDSCTTGFEIGNIQLTKIKNLPSDFKCGEILSTDSIPPNESLSTPTNFKTTLVETSKVELTWDGVAGATEYILKRGTSIIYTGSDRTFSDLALIQNTTYTYSVAAKNGINISSYATLSVETIGSPPPLPAPSDIYATNITKSSMDVSWDSVIGATSYILKRDGNVIYTGSNTTFSDTSLLSDTFYYYSIAAKNATTESSYSLGSSFKTLTATPPSGPTNFKATNIKDTSMDLSWDSVSGALLYSLRRDETTIYSGYNLNFSDNGLNANTTYTYSLWVLYSDGSGGIAVLNQKTNNSTPNSSDPTVRLPSVGNGTISNPYIITTVGELQGIRIKPSSYFKLGNDIDASGTSSWNGGLGFEPIGKDPGEDSSYTPFYGSLDGDSHIINGLTINRPTGVNVGLFGFETQSKIKNIGLTNVSIVGKSGVGGLIGFSVSSTNVENVFVTGSVKGSFGYAGGLIGITFDGTIKNSFSHASVTGGSYVGGLVGSSELNILNSYSTGKVTTTDSNVGGLLGSHAFGSINSSYWDTLTSTRSTSKGGTGKTTTQMKTQATYVGWDFTNIWNIDPGINDGYPYLRFN